MGGFYTDENNYFKFQSDLTEIKYASSSDPADDPFIKAANVPKKFFLDMEEREGNPSIIKAFNNSLVRPKIDY